MNDLEQRYRALSRQFHPDYFHNAGAAERRASLEHSSYLNDAYRALKQSSSRIEYLIGLESGDGSPKAHGGAGDPKVPASLLEEVFALNEELDEIRELRSSGAPETEWRPRLERARQPIEAKRQQHEAQLDELSAQWDAALDAGRSDAERRPILEALRERFLEKNYIANLLGVIEGELGRDTSNPTLHHGGH
jgi:Fe-S protein assembly co-chaperone HscB